MHHLFEAHLPDSHRDIDELMREGFDLPSWHPDISGIVIPRSLVISPGAMLAFAVAEMFLIIVLARNFTKWRNSFRTREVIVTTKNTTANETSIGETATSDASSASSDSQ